MKSDLEKFSEAYKRYRDYEKEELAESCYDLERENKKLKERIKGLEYLGDINEELKEENKELREMLKSNGQMVTMRESTIYRLEEENYKLEEENIKLKKKLEQIKETYIRFEDSEKEYNKGLGELDQLIMNR